MSSQLSEVGKKFYIQAPKSKAELWFSSSLDWTYFDKPKKSISYQSCHINHEIKTEHWLLQLILPCFCFDFFASKRYNFVWRSQLNIHERWLRKPSDLFLVIFLGLCPKQQTPHPPTPGGKNEDLGKSYMPKMVKYAI